MADLQLSYTHSFNLNDLLGNSNFIGIHPPCMIIVLYYSLFIDYIELQHSIAAPFCQFDAYLSVFFVRLCFQFLDHCDKLIWYQSSWQDEAHISQKKCFWHILHEKLSKSSKFQHCTRSQGLPLNTPSQGIVDQACLINCAGCDENLKRASCRTYGAPFIFL